MNSLSLWGRDVIDRLAEALGGFSDVPSAATAGVDHDMEEAGSGSSSSTAWKGVGYVRIDGSHDSQERLTAVRRFKTDPSVRVALLSITAAAVGG